MEEALPSIDLDSGAPVAHEDEDPEVLLLDDHHELDLTGTVRDAISLAEPIVALCRPDCRGLCLTCGIDLNADPSHSHGDDDLDPRLEALLAIRERLDRADLTIITRRGRQAGGPTRIDIQKELEHGSPQASRVPRAAG